MINNIDTNSLYQQQSYNPYEMHTWIDYNGETFLMPVNPSTIYNLRNGNLKHGARINNDGTMITKLGGNNKGAATIAVNMNEGGQYYIYLDFKIESRPFKLDINGVNTGEIYMTSKEIEGVFTTVLSLNKGINIIKFYGDNTKPTSDFGKFTLAKALKNQMVVGNKSYDVANGNLENGANINMLTNFVTALGGMTDGSSTVNVNVNKAGRYNVEIDYLAYDVETTLKIDVNGINIAYYVPPFTDGEALDSVLNFNFSIDLNLGNNQIKFHGDGINKAPDLGSFSITAIKETKSYDYASFNSLSFNDLINLLKSIKYTDIKGLYSFTKESKEFFENSSRVDAIIQAVANNGKTYSIINNEGIETLIEVLRAAYYLAYDNAELKYLNDLGEKKKCLPAIKAVQKNSNFKLIVGGNNKVIKAIARLIEYTTLDGEVINNFTPILHQFKESIKLNKKEYKKRDTIYKILNSIETILIEFLEANGNNIKATDIYGNIEEFLNSLEDLCIKGINSPSYASEFFINVISFTGKLSKFKVNKFSTQEVLSKCVETYSYFSRMNIEALVMLKRYFNGKFSDGRDIEYKNRIEQFKIHYLPNWYSFDDGEIIIRAGSAISKENIKKIYWSIKEVRAEFFKFSGSDTPLQSGKDDILNIIIYNSLEDFKFNYRLYNCNTRGIGGVYLEQLGYIYTTERAKVQGRFLLEETFRHEYVHYLEQRFITPGIDNTGDFYEHGNSKRLLWFGEGLADFLTGSTRKNGIKARKSMFEKVDKNLLKPIKEIVKVKEWKAYLYYDYYCLMYYFYNYRRDILNNIRDLIMNNEVTLYDSLMDTLAHDEILNDNFHKVIKDLINNLNSLTIPLASDYYLNSHTDGNIESIKSTIKSIIFLQNITTKIEVSDEFKTFILSGIYNEGKSIDALTDYSNMDKILNTALSSLDIKKWSGYKTFTAYFTDYIVDNYGQVTFKITFHGFLSN